MNSSLILVVEDEDPLREVIKKALQKEGYRVIAASDPTKAIEALGAELFRVNLLFADIVMPEMSGSEFAKDLLMMRPDLKVVFATGANVSETNIDLAKIRHQIFLQKPFTVEQIRDAVRIALMS